MTEIREIEGGVTAAKGFWAASTEAGIKYLAPLVIGEVDIEYEAGLPKHIVL